MAATDTPAAYPRLAEAGQRLSVGKRLVWLPWLALASLFLAYLPLFLCMPLWADPSYFDLCARGVLRGGVLYRDVFYFGPPGMVWLQTAIRSVVGWRSEALRAADVGIVALSIWLLVRLLPPSFATTGRAWTAVVLFAFYFSTSEWCHCQPDVWMLLPALVALHLRRGQVADLSNETPSARRVVLRGLAEGLCWGAAVLIKPHVGLPAVLAWLAAATWVWRQSPQGRKRIVVDAIAVVTGGLLAGGLCLTWMSWSGAWDSFLATARGWNASYYSGRSIVFAARVKEIFKGTWPWSLVHLVAVPLALLSLARLALARSSGAAPLSHSDEAREGILAGVYLGWFFQAGFLQWAHPYHLVAPVLLGLIVVAGRIRIAPTPRWAVVALVGFLAYAAWCHPLSRPERLALWGRCWQEGSGPDLRDRLALYSGPNGVTWTDLERVADFLREQGVGDGELTCYQRTTIPLYLQLGCRPSNRFLWIDALVHFFPDHSEEIRRELAASSQRFIVSDIGAVYLSPSRVVWERADDPMKLPGRFPEDWAARYPWCEPIVFRSGRYLVHRADGPVRELTGVARE